MPFLKKESQYLKGVEMQKGILLAPGPTPIPPKVLQVMSEPIIHHRSPEFEKILGEVKEGIKWLFKTKNEVLIFTSSGTGAMEGVVSNLFSRGDKVLVVNGGKFGERWGEISGVYGLEVRNIKVSWGEAVDPMLIKENLEKDPEIKGVFTQASETSTGVSHPIKEISEIIKGYEDTLMIVDTITAIGVFDIPTDEWHLDAVVAGSQKALMLPPGLSFVALSEKAWRFVEKSTLPKYYFDFKKELSNLIKSQNAYTPAISLILGLREVLREMREEGLENIFSRHEKLAKATRKAILALGLELYAPSSPSNAVTAIKAPQGIDAQQIVRVLREKYGITIAGGQGEARGKIFRIAHLGYVSKFDIISAISALEMTLKDLGYRVDLGQGVRVAMEILGGEEEVS